VISTLIGLFFFKEIPQPLEWLGIAVTLGGTFMVLMDGQNQFEGDEKKRTFLTGVGCGVMAAIGQATGMALAKNGLTDQFPSLSGTLMRMISAMLVIWLLAIFGGKARTTLHEASLKPNGVLAIMVGSIVGPFLGVWCSLIATQSEKLGIASTLTSLTPIFVLPFVHFFFKEKVSRRAVAGTIVALMGTAIIILTRAGLFSL
jgi:drug/metabolite transporter (DMT)-like permease